MDEYYKACQEKLRDNKDPVGTISELASLALNDLPKIQICNFAEQSVSLLSVVHQNASCPTAELMAQLRRIRKQLSSTLDFLEEILEVQVEFPDQLPSSADAYWQ